MLYDRCLRLLPSTLLLLIATAPIPSQTLNSPWSRHDQGLGRRQISGADSLTENAQKISDQKPVRVRKMTDDEGEMFFHDYWGFEDIEEGTSRPLVDRRFSSAETLDSLDESESAQDWSNASIPQPMQAPFALHTDDFHMVRPLMARILQAPNALFHLEKRAFQCPGGTNACTSINRPNSCCYSGSTCEIVPDTGSGDVGCCGSGQECGAQVANCADGNTACPGSQGGGCCIPGYACSGVGCKFFQRFQQVDFLSLMSILSGAINTTATTTIQPIVTASPPRSSSTPPSTSANETPSPPAVIPPSSTDAITQTSTFTAVTSVISTATSSSPPPSSTPPSSSTPRSTTPRPTTTSAPAVLPVRPTSSTIPTTTTTDPPSTITASQCPTGFYQCSAYEHPGCCRVGRDCGLTSCPAASPTLAFNSNGVTVSVIPSGANDAALGANGCAAGWFTCASGDGGGCCPSGYACGTSCTATAVVVQGGKTGTATVAKDNAAGPRTLRGWIMFAWPCITALFLI